MMASALRLPQAPDHVRIGGGSDALAAIDRPEITLAIWDRSPPVNVGSLRGLVSASFQTDVEGAAAMLAKQLAQSPQRQWHRALTADVAELAALYAKIMQLDRVEIRLERVTGNACWRFHADYVAVRLITTYSGRGTQWLDQATALAPQAGGETPPFHQLPTGAVGLFKGRLLAPNTAITHRSPPIDGTGAERLLLVIDPVRIDPPV